MPSSPSTSSTVQTNRYPFPAGRTFGIERNVHFSGDHRHKRLYRNCSLRRNLCTERDPPTHKCLVFSLNRRGREHTGGMKTCLLQVQPSSTTTLRGREEKNRERCFVGNGLVKFLEVEIFFSGGIANWMPSVVETRNSALYECCLLDVLVKDWEQGKCRMCHH